jgi:hypothetical protein
VCFRKCGLLLRGSPAARRDAQLDAERAWEKAQEKARADAEKRAAQEQIQAAQERAQAEQRALEARQAAEKTAIQVRYQKCVGFASDAYDASWAAQCKRIGEQSVKEHAECISGGLFPKSVCDGSHKIEDGSPNCKLPHFIAVELKSNWDKAQDRCLQERNAGLQ